MFSSLNHSFLDPTTQPKRCKIEGNGPFCDGVCDRGWTKYFEITNGGFSEKCREFVKHLKTQHIKTLWTNCDAGGSCWTGKKVFCCQCKIS